MYVATAEEADKFGLSPYEVSNYAAAGAESRHNLAYWRYADYAGIGPGAHGRVTLGGIGGVLTATRRHRAPEPWAERVERDGHGSTAEEILSSEDRAREMLLMGLRLSEGIDARRFFARTEVQLAEAMEPEILEQALAAGYLVADGPILRATTEGRLRLDALLAALVV